MPKLHDYFNEHKIEIVSARDLFQSVHPTDPIQWKVKCFRQQINLKASKINDRKDIMLISIGDGLFERIACRDIAFEMNLPYCSLKLLENPNPVTLSNQLELITSCLSELIALPPNREKINRSNLHDCCNDLYFDYNSEGYLCIYHWEKVVPKSVEVEKSSSDCLINSEVQDGILTKNKCIPSIDDDDNDVDQLVLNKLNIADDHSICEKSEEISISNTTTKDSRDENDDKPREISIESKKYDTTNNDDDTSDDESEVEFELDDDNLDKLYDLLTPPVLGKLGGRVCDSRNSDLSSEFSGYTDHTHSRSSSIDYNISTRSKVSRTISSSSIINGTSSKLGLTNIFEDERL